MNTLSKEDQETINRIGAKMMSRAAHLKMQKVLDEDAEDLQDRAIVIRGTIALVVIMVAVGAVIETFLPGGIISMFRFITGMVMR